MSHTNMVRAKTTNTNPRRSRGPRQGYQQNRNNTSNINDDHNSQHSKYFRDENRFENACNTNENEYSIPSYHRENRQRTRGHGDYYHNNDNNRSEQSNNFREEFNVGTVRSGNNYEQPNFKKNRKHNRGQGNFKNNYSERETPKRSHSSSSSQSSRSVNGDKIKAGDYVPVEEKNILGIDSSRLPRHAQHPIFVGELMSRFNNLLPSSEFLESEVHNPEHQVSMSNQYNSDNKTNTFASISNNIDHGFRKSCNEDPNHINLSNRYTGVKSGLKKTSLGCEESKYEGVIENNKISPSSLLPEGMFSGGNGFPVEGSKAQQYSSIKDETNGKKSKNNKKCYGDKRTQFKCTTDSSNTLPFNFHNSGDINSQFRYQREPSSNFNRAEPMSLVNMNQKSKQEASINVDKQQVSRNNYERRNQILADYGFKGMTATGTMTNDVKTINDTQLKALHQPTTASLLFSEIDEFESHKNTAMGKTPRSNKCDEGDTFKPQMNRCTNISTSPISPRSPIVTNTLPSFELPRQIDNYNSFIESQRTSNHQPIDQKKVIKQQESNGQFENINPSSVFNEPNASIQNRLGMTNETFAGGRHFNIQGTAVGLNQRVPSRPEVVQKRQDEYNVMAVEYEEQRRVKEAKKREQYLARYQHVDQGHRLAEGFLDEAAGYDPGFIQPLDEVRQRQQEQFRQEALLYQEHQRQENENRRKREEENQKAWLNKQKHVDAGHRLGGRKNQGGGNRGGRQQTRAPLAKSSSVESNLLQEQTSTYDERVHDQLSGGIQGSRQQTRTPLTKSSSAESNLVREKPLTHDEEGRHDHLRYAQQTGLPVSAVKPANSTAVTANTVQANTNPVERKVIEENIAQKQHLSALGSSSVKSEMPNTTSSKKEIPEEKQKLLIPASCVIKNKTAAPLLVLRPSEEILNQALIKHLEVQDDMDKHGQSALYKPNCEKVPLYGNNRIVNKSATESSKDTGAIPKQKTTLSSRSPLPESSVPIVDSNEQVKPVMDPQAEMRLARVRLQQQYEEALKKLQKD